MTTDDPDFDLTAVTAAHFEVQRGDGSIATWACVVSDQTATACRLTHVFAPSDVPDPDELVLEPRLTVPGGELVATPARLTVRPKFT